MPPDPGPESLSGWGLYLVDQLTDRWGVTGTDGTRVWFEIDREPAAGRSSQRRVQEPGDSVSFVATGGPNGPTEVVRRR
jgi:hypothetical protein